MRDALEISMADSLALCAHMPPQKPGSPKRRIPNNTPKEFLCAISGMIMKEPVVASDNCCYDRQNITEHISMSKTPVLSPVTKEPLQGLELFENKALKEGIRRFMAKRA